LKRVIFEVEQSTKDKKTKKKVIKNACKMLSELYDPDECSAVIATEVHRIAYEALGDKDPYRHLKDLSNRVAQSLVPRVEELIKKSDDPLGTSILCSIIGNTMDFGIEGGSSHPNVLKDLFEKYVSDGLGYDDTLRVKVLLGKTKRVVLFADNCGEIVFDKVLCREIKKFNPKVFLSLVVRGEPIISDATMKDTGELRFDEVVDEVLTTGCFAVGVDFKRMPDDLKNVLEKADLIICKGMANYESFSETRYHPVAYFLRTKCTAIANSMELPLNINAVKLYQ